MWRRDLDTFNFSEFCCHSSLSLVREFDANTYICCWCGCCWCCWSCWCFSFGRFLSNHYENTSMKFPNLFWLLLRWFSQLRLKRTKRSSRTRKVSRTTDYFCQQWEKQNFRRISAKHNLVFCPIWYLICFSCDLTCDMCVTSSETQRWQIQIAFHKRPGLFHSHNFGFLKWMSFDRITISAVWTWINLKQ